MTARRALTPGLASVLFVVAGVACNAVFHITEGEPRPQSGEAGDTQTGGTSGSGGGPNGGTGAVPKGGGSGKGGATSGGAAGLGTGGGRAGTSGGSAGATGGGGNDNGGTGGGSAGSLQGMGGTLDNGGMGGDTSAMGGDTNGGGTGGSNGGAGGTGGMADGHTLVEFGPQLIWPRCSEDTNGLAATCHFYGDTGKTTCSDPAVSFAKRGAIQTQTIDIGGVAGETYTVRLHSYGTVTTRCYTGGAFANPDAYGRSWYIAGAPTDSNGTSYELHVKDSNGIELGVHYLNAIREPDGSGDTTPPCETGSIQTLSDTVTLNLPGGGTIDAVVHDADCQMDTNCSPDTTSYCFPYGPSASSTASPLGAPFVQVQSRFVPLDTDYPASSSAAFSQFMYLEVKYVVN